MCDSRKQNYTGFVRVFHFLFSMDISVTFWPSYKTPLSDYWYTTEISSLLAKNINSLWYYQRWLSRLLPAVGFPAALKLRLERVNAPSVNSRTSRLSVSFIGHPLPSTGHCSSSHFRPGPRCSSLTSDYGTAGSTIWREVFHERTLVSHTCS